MAEQHSFMSATLAELNRRKVLRTVGAYAVGVFVLLQLIGLIIVIWQPDVALSLMHGVYDVE